MYIDLVPNRGPKPAIPLRESIREGKRIRKRTIANLSALTLEQAEAIRLVLKGEKLAPAGGRPRLHPLAAAWACGGRAHRDASARLRRVL
jgi:hypothetical protein